MSFADDIKRHLCEYKRRKFPNFRNGFWMRSNPPKELCYAFVPEEADYNLIDTYKDRFLEYEENLQQRITRHMYFHHMNSSQVKCFNFFFPLLLEGKLGLITDYLGFYEEKINYQSVQFEKLSEIEPAYGRRPTNFDFYFETESGKKFYFEIKYTEYDFGKAPKDKLNNENFDAEYIVKFNTMYSNHLDAIKPNFRVCHEFLGNYQLMRNLIHIGPDSYVVLIYPNENRRVYQEITKAKREIVADQYLPNLFTIDWSEIFDSVSGKVQHPEIKAQFDEFREKYFIE